MASVTCSQCGTSQPDRNTICSQCAEPLPRASRIRTSVEETILANRAVGAIEERGDPFHEDSSRLRIVTPWGDRIVLEENDRMMMGRDSASPWSKRMGSHISNRHAEMYLQSGALYVVDVRSTNGTFVNDDRIVPQIPCQVNAGDVIKLGWDEPCVLHIERDGA